jgi:prepilin-type N-terminal cleavage/methylation domain-containing protein
MRLVAGGSMKRSARSGFTLIEIMIVVGIIGILVVVLLAVLLNAAKKKETSVAENFVTNAVPEAMKKWQDDNGKNDSTYPPSPNLVDNDKYFVGNNELFAALITEPKGRGKDPYIEPSAFGEGTENGKPVFLDPWNRPYIYRNYSMKKSASGKNRTYVGRRYNENTYDIISMGPDGVLYEDENDNNDDIYNGIE